MAHRDEAGGLNCDLLIRYAGLTPNSKVLLLGADDTLLPALHEYLQHGNLEVHDQSSKIAAQVRYRYRRRARTLRHPIVTDHATHDIVICPGLLQHVYLEDVGKLFGAASRALRHGRDLICTLRLLNHYSRSHLQQNDFRYRTPAGWYRYRSNPLRAVALPEQGVRRLLIRHRLQPKDPIRYGNWGGGPNAVCEGDLLVAVRV